MSAVLKRVFPVARPAFNNANLAIGALWLSDNDKALRAYYFALGGVLPKPSDDRVTRNSRANHLMCFAVLQWDLERTAEAKRVEANRQRQAVVA